MASLLPKPSLDLLVPSLVSLLAGVALTKYFLPPPPPPDYDSDDSYDSDAAPVPSVGLSAKEWGLKHAPYKLVLCVDKSLKVREGRCVRG